MTSRPRDVGVIVLLVLSVVLSTAGLPAHAGATNSSIVAHEWRCSRGQGRLIRSKIEIDRTTKRPLQELIWVHEGRRHILHQLLAPLTPMWRAGKLTFAEDDDPTNDTEVLIIVRHHMTTRAHCLAVCEPDVASDMTASILAQQRKRCDTPDASLRGE